MGPSLEERAGADEPPVEEMSYTEASAELDRIVGFFEGREVDVDQLVGRLVRATAIIEELDKRLRQTRMQVEQLVPRLTAVLEETAVPDDTAVPEETAQPDETTGPDEVAPLGTPDLAGDGEDGPAPGLF